MKLKTLLFKSGIDYSANFADVDIVKIVSDSRLSCENCLYVCIKGLHQDGHLFIDDAIAAGAVAVIVEDGVAFEQYDDIIFISVPKTRKALSHLFNAWYGMPSDKMKYIAVTGTNGKTSVTYILKKIFEASLYRCGLIGTISCLSMDRRLISDNMDKTANMTTPDPEQLYAMLADMVNDGVEYVFVEASSHALALDKLSPIHFTATVFTNFTSEHLDFHGSMQNYLDAKKKIFSISSVVIINKDLLYYKDITSSLKCKKITCSQHDNTANYRASNIINNGLEGVCYKLHSPFGLLNIKSRLPGHFMIMNTLEAAACALELGVSRQIVEQAIFSITSIDGRLERVDLGDEVAFDVFIDYAHTPDALENLLSSVQQFKRKDQKITLLFGCGGDRDKYKRPVMGEIATRLADRVIITSDNCRNEDPQSIINDIILGIEGRKNFEVIVDRSEAIEHAVFSAKDRDIIILAGKGHELYEINRGKRYPFSEKKIVSDSLKKRLLSNVDK